MPRATYLISLTESAEMVCRRGRWISLRVMEIYLQEVAASTFLTDIDPEAKKKILFAMRQFPEVLRMSMRFSSSRFPEKAWNVFFKQEPRGDSMPGQVERMQQAQTRWHHRHTAEIRWQKRCVSFPIYSSISSIFHYISSSSYIYIFLRIKYIPSVYHYKSL